jgi:hypothetical protein
LGRFSSWRTSFVEAIQAVPEYSEARQIAAGKNREANQNRRLIVGDEIHKGRRNIKAAQRCVTC